MPERAGIIKARPLPQTHPRPASHVRPTTPPTCPRNIDSRHLTPAQNIRSLCFSESDQISPNLRTDTAGLTHQPWTEAISPIELSRPLVSVRPLFPLRQTALRRANLGTLRTPASSPTIWTGWHARLHGGRIIENDASGSRKGDKKICTGCRFMASLGLRIHTCGEKDWDRVRSTVGYDGRELRLCKTN